MEMRIKPLLTGCPELRELRRSLHRMVSLIMGVQCPLDTLSEFVSEAGLAGQLVQEPLNDRDDVPTVAQTIESAKRTVRLLTEAIADAQSAARSAQDSSSFERLSAKAVITEHVLHMLGERGVGVVGVAGDEGWLLMDRRSFVPAMAALIEEAAGNTPAGAERIRVLVREAPAEGTVELRCLRSGPALNDEASLLWSECLTETQEPVTSTNGEPKPVNALRMLALHDADLQIHYSDQGVELILTFPYVPEEQSKDAHGQ